MTPIRKGTAERLGLRHRPAVAEFEAVIDHHISAVKAECDPAVVALFDAEAELCREVFADHRRRLDALAHHHRSRAEIFGRSFAAAFRAL